MTRHILDIIKEQTVIESTSAPTEKAQIVVMFTYGNQNIFRFASVKKAEKEYKALVKAWDLCKARGGGPSLFDLDGDMFVGAVDLSQVTSVCFVDHAKRAKFTPIPG